MKTYSTKPADIERRWFVVDAEGKVLGRLAVEVANILRGKHKPIFSPHMDCGDFVIVVNAEKVRLTGNKLDKKMYYSHSGQPGHLKSATAKQMMIKHAEKIMIRAVRGMLPHNRLGREVLSKLKVYLGPAHPHQAQQPTPLEIRGA